VKAGAVGRIREAVRGAEALRARIGCLELTKARARRPRERKGNERHFSFPALTGRANLCRASGAGFGSAGRNCGAVKIEERSLVAAGRAAAALSG
jgi:hypothetical protein